MRAGLEAVSQSGRKRGQRERVEAAGVDVGFLGEEDVVAAGEVPVLGGAAHDADAAGEDLVGFAGARERRARVAADEDDDRACVLGAVARVGEGTSR